MKYIMPIAVWVGLLCMSVYITEKTKPSQCKLVQRYYLKGELVMEITRDSMITEHGCLTFLLINGKDVWADSIVTTLK